MKKSLFIGLFITLIFPSVFAQSGTRFLENTPWVNVRQQAKQENKLIFVDCYTSWCGPCKQLATEIFPQKIVGDFMNSKFVNVKYDMEKEEGLTFNQKYPDAIKAYPTMLIINTTGEIIHKIVGSMPAEELLSAIEEGLQGNTIYTFEKEYQKGNKDWTFIKKYLVALKYANEKETYEQVARTYISRFPIDSLLNLEIWNIMKDIIVKDPYSREFRFTVAHINDLEQRGVERYPLEQELSSSIGFAVNMLLIGCLNTENKDTLQIYEEQAKQLRSLLMHPIKGFPESLAELSLNECRISGNVNELYKRFCVLMNCGFIKRSIFQEYMLEYLIQKSNNKQHLQTCIDYLLALQKNTSGWEKENINKTIVTGKEKLNSCK